MSKNRMCIGSINTEFEFFWKEPNVKALTISWPSYRMVVELATRTDTERRSVRLWYNKEEIPLLTDDYDLEEELFAIPAPQDIYEWIEKNDPDTLTWWNIDDFSVWMVQRVFAVMIVQYKNYKELHFPIIGYYLKKGGENAQDFHFADYAAQYFHFADYAAVVLNNKEAQSVGIYFLSLNMRLALYLRKEAGKNESPKERREVYLENGDKKPLGMDYAKYEALLDKFEEEYFGPMDFIQTGDFEEWLGEMYRLLQMEMKTEADADVATDAVDTAEGTNTVDTTAYQKLRAMFYAQTTPDFFEGVIRALPEKYRSRILYEFSRAVNAAKEEIVPGDIVMFEHGGKHLVVSNDGDTLHTITKRAGRMISDSIPLEKAFPTGGHYDTWDDVDQELNLFF